MEDTKICPYCGKQIMATAKKCRYCGEWLDKDVASEKEVKMIPCPICGEKIKEHTEICPYCNEKVSNEKEIKSGLGDTYNPSNNPSSLKSIHDKEQNKRLLYGGGIVFLFSVIIVLIFFNYHKQPDNINVQQVDNASVSDASTSSQINLPKEVLLDASSDDRKCVYYVNDTCCIKQNTQTSELTYILNIKEGTVQLSNIKDNDGEELAAFKIAAKKVDSSSRYILFALDRESCEMESYEFVGYDTYKDEYRYFGTGRGVYSDSSEFFDDDLVVLKECRVTNMETASCAADYDYATLNNYYDFDGNYKYSSS